MLSGGSLSGGSHSGDPRSGGVRTDGVRTRAAARGGATPRLLCAAVAVLLAGCSGAGDVAATSPEVATPSAAVTASAAPATSAPHPPGPGDPNPTLAPSADAPCVDVAALPLREKLAQLLMVGVTGLADARAVVADHRVGGIFVGSWTDLSMLGAPLAGVVAAGGPLPLAVSVDEEGGSVSRLSGLIGSQPSARELAAGRSVEDVYALARERGAAMRGLGITVDFAPVVDLTAGGGVIGDRSFSADPQVTTAYAGAYARGLRDAGVLPVLKHFPGHGRASGDSHAEGVVTPPLDELRERDLVPYRTLTAQGPVGVMLGHLRVPGLTGDEPASLSPAATELLRSGSYGGPPFDGPVFTDDLSGMRAVTDRYGVAEAVLRALRAGADQALWLTTDEVPAVLDRLAAAVDAGELPVAGVDAAVARVARMKGVPPGCGG